MVYIFYICLYSGHNIIVVSAVIVQCPAYVHIFSFLLIMYMYM